MESPGSGTGRGARKDCGCPDRPSGGGAMTPVPSKSHLLDLLVSKLAARLGVDPSAIGPRESFQSHGLDSSGSVGFIADLSAALGRTLSPTLIWAHPTPEALARFLAGGDSGPARTSRSMTADEPIAVVGM